METVRLDNIIPEDVAVDVLKIDVEGHELGVLKGARAPIERSPDLHIIMEWSRPQMLLAGIDPAEILELLKKFRCYYTETVGDWRLATPRDTSWLMAQNYANVLFTRY